MGSRLKNIAKRIVNIGMIVIVFAGAVLLYIGVDYDIGSLIVGGIVLLTACPALAWVLSWILRGLGELIDKMSEIAQNTQGGEKIETYCERLNKIENLRAQGIITQEEYQAKRTEIISKL